ncbi:hypothetical protein ACOMHN_021989 [Nucella lapillus]
MSVFLPKCPHDVLQSRLQRHSSGCTHGQAGLTIRPSCGAQDKETTGVWVNVEGHRVKKLPGPICQGANHTTAAMHV